MNSSDPELLAACRRGDQTAWERLMDQYGRLVYSIPLNYGLSQTDAADISQSTFTYFIQALPNLRDDSNLGAWLATVARRQSWRLLYKKQRESVSLEQDLNEDDPRLSTGTEWTERWAQLEWLNSGLNYLPERCRRLLLLLYFEPQEPSYAQIAAQMGIAVGSIGPTRARCLEQLKMTLQRGSGAQH